jgi:two-component system, NarL family, nitrate/nitrite response regulator NarL
MDAVSARAAKKIRVLVADSSRIHTQLLSDALKRDPGLEIVLWDFKPASLIATALAHNVDVLAISSALHGHATQGLDVVRELRAANPQSRSVILLDSQKNEVVINAFRAGARGIFSREGSVELFCKCIRSVHQGEIWADTREVTLAIEALASTPEVRAVGANGLSLLSKRELEVVQYLAQGLTNREIAERMGLSQHTIKNYLFRVFDKLGVSSRVELLFMTLSQGNNSDDSLLPALSKKAVEGGQHDEATLAFFQKAAEKGLPAAQLALAQAYLARRAQPDDLVHAYMWYLVATERTSQARALITRMLTAKQIDEAQQKASVWLARMKQASSSLPSSISAPGAMESAAGSFKRLKPAKSGDAHDSEMHDLEAQEEAQE